jgi:hypothetical protein
MNNNTISSDAFGGVSKKFLSRIIALILEKISYRTDMMRVQEMELELHHQQWKTNLMQI